MADDKQQIEKFKEAARDLDCDDDNQRFAERLRRVAATNVVQKGEKPAGKA